MIDFSLTPLQAELRDRVTRFVREQGHPARERCAPGCARTERRTAARTGRDWQRPRACCRRMRRPSTAGSGSTTAAWRCSSRRRATACSARSPATSRRPTRATPTCCTGSGTHEQKKRWLRPLVAGEIRSVFSMTEPDDGAGAEPSLMKTTARADGNDFVIDGRKWLITGDAGDQPLAAVDDEVVALGARGRLHQRRVGPAPSWLGHREHAADRAGDAGGGASAPSARACRPCSAGWRCLRRAPDVAGERTEQAVARRLEEHRHAAVVRPSPRPRPAHAATAGPRPCEPNQLAPQCALGRARPGAHRFSRGMTSSRTNRVTRSRSSACCAAGEIDHRRPPARRAWPRVSLRRGPNIAGWRARSAPRSRRAGGRCDAGAR